MIATSPQPTPLGARAILDMAAEVEAAEIRIKQAVLEAARAGDAPRIVEIVTRWMSMPAAEVLAKSP